MRIKLDRKTQSITLSPLRILKLQNFGCAILITDHQVNNLFDIVDRAYVLGEQSIIAQGTPSEILKSSKAIELYFGSSYRA